MERKNAWKTYDAEKLNMVNVLSAEYMEYLDHSKTERECVDTTVNMIEKEGYVELEELIRSGKKLSAGDKVYAVLMNKFIIMFQMGTKPMTEGMNILGAHIDSPRIDVKQNPLFEDNGFALLDTHYYGGIKKYQWIAHPLALHGIVVKKDGTIVEINVGDNENDPVFFISDILIHLAGEQMSKSAKDIIGGEALDLIIGSKPLEGEEKEAVKAGVFKILQDTYDFEEEDFLSAELEIVPAGKTKEAGFDRSMIMGYGQDDRVCAFTSLKAMLEIGQTDRCACCILCDKEETGSRGATGMTSRFFENVVAEVLNLAGEYSELNLRRCLAASNMLSSDVSAAFDPNFPSVFEKKNTAFFGRGMVFNKYTGAGGKSGSNDANPEYIAHIRKIMDDAGVNFQTAELGRVDAGGGGTIAYIMAAYGMNVIDCGVPVLCMHAPWEVTSKADIYETKCGYAAFLEKACL